MRRVLLLGLTLGTGCTAHSESPSATAVAVRVLELSGMPEMLRISDSAYVATLLRTAPQLRPYEDVLKEWSGHVYDWDVVGPALAQRLVR